MDFIKKCFKKVFTREVIIYIIFGLITTFINIGVFKILSGVFHLEENLSSNIGILCAFLTAYFTNRKWVFHSTASGMKEKLLEFSKFFLGRLFTILLESGGFYLLFSILHINENISKFSIIVVVVILNYIISKFFAFKKIKE